AALSRKVNCCYSWVVGVDLLFYGSSFSDDYWFVTPDTLRSRTPDANSTSEKSSAEAMENGLKDALIAIR
ncbi:MAG: hypothetical protein K6C08_13970, partial [Oscillospiraceae bacterium]|nr:hypothetical protein [Oscillospiraceae bacterium]